MVVVYAGSRIDAVDGLDLFVWRIAANNATHQSHFPDALQLEAPATWPDSRSTILTVSVPK
jgi:hypothetical protein